MIRRVRIWFPVMQEYEDTIDVEIPDDIDSSDLESWLNEKAISLIKGHWNNDNSEEDLDFHLDMGDAGAELAEEDAE